MGTERNNGRDAFMRQRLTLETSIAGSTDREVIEQAIASWNEALSGFIFPPELAQDPNLAPLLEIRDIVLGRIDQASAHATDIIHDLNERMDQLHNPESHFHELVAKDREQWTEGAEEHVMVGSRACVDSGIPREAIAGLEDPIGRTLGGDDRIVFVPQRNTFQLEPTLISKRLIHSALTGSTSGLELIVEHTDCGRRMQMILNLDAKNETSQLARTIVRHLSALAPEFKAEDAERKVADLLALWHQEDPGSTPHMTKDGGKWIGIIMKIAQRQAYKDLRRTVNLELLAPIELYDKYDGNVLTGLDSLDALAHPLVAEEGGFTPNALEKLITDGIVFSLKHSVQAIEATGLLDLNSEFGMTKGERSFEDVQTHWLDALDSRITMTGNLWRMYRDADPRYDAVRSMADSFFSTATREVADTLARLEETPEGAQTARLLKNRLLHQIFQALAYAWQQDTFTQGHKAGQHLENYLATGESGYTGLKKHLALGQGDLSEPTAAEMYTGRSVLLHSHRVDDNEPVVALLKNDTTRPANVEMTSEETRPAMRTFREILKLWPYVLVGDTVPFIVIKGEPDNGAISRIARSVLKSFHDILLMQATEGGLPDVVPATNSAGEVVYVAATDVLRVGIEAREDLKAFRDSVKELANSVSNTVYQRNLQ